MQKISQTGPIVFYDSDCGLCQRSVRFILRWEKDAALQFASLGSNTFTAIGIEAERLPDSVLLYENGQVFMESEAAWRIARYLKFPFNLLQGIRIVPAKFRNFCYRFIARHRHKIFGIKQHCDLPQAGQSNRFLS